MPDPSRDEKSQRPTTEATRGMRTDWFTLGAAGGFLGAIIAVGLPLWRRSLTHDAPHTEPVKVFESESELVLPGEYPQLSAYSAEELPDALLPTTENEGETERIVSFLVDLSPKQEGSEGESAPTLRLDLPHTPPEDEPCRTADIPGEGNDRDSAFESDGLFQAGEIVRKGKSLRKRMLEPNLGIVLQAFTAYEPVTYKVLFFDGEESRRDIYWEEDLIRLNERERELFLKTYPDETRAEIVKLSRRNRERARK